MSTSRLSAQKSPSSASYTLPLHALSLHPVSSPLRQRWCGSPAAGGIPQLAQECSAAPGVGCIGVCGPGSYDACKYDRMRAPEAGWAPVLAITDGRGMTVEGWVDDPPTPPVLWKSLTTLHSFGIPLGSNIQCMTPGAKIKAFSLKFGGHIWLCAGFVHALFPQSKGTQHAYKASTKPGFVVTKRDCTVTSNAD
ncbi:hypothetical protein B0H19DRAFT_1232678 [Mycena capillaripes]|nr:hypothetical protein B0H19DRAFT_1232678 [Mycena capillaripes]